MKQTSHTVTDWLDKRARLTPDRVALIDYGTRTETTYAEWNARANRTANFLRSLNVEKGDRVIQAESQVGQQARRTRPAPNAVREQKERVDSVRDLTHGRT